MRVATTNPKTTTGGTARIHELRDLLTRANTAYYADAAPFMSDAEFDTLLAELASLEAAHPELADQNSPTQRVGGAALEGEFEPRKHRAPMLSVDNTYSVDELRVWYQRCADALGARGTRSSEVVRLICDDQSRSDHHRRSP